MAAAVAGLLGVPLSRLSDTSSFVRCRALQTLSLLAESRALPTPQLHQAAECGLARLADKNANVRKGALQLFKAVIEENPFTAMTGTLGLAALTSRRDALREKLGVAADAPSPPAAANDAADAAGAEGGEEEGEEGEGGASTADAAPPPTAVVAAPPEEDAATRDARVALEFLELAIRFEGVLRARLPEVNALLGSQNQSDVVEAMRAIVSAHSFGLEGARPAKCLTLVWSKEAPIRAEALQSAQNVWLRVANSSRGGATLPETLATARELFSLVSVANLAELTSLEEVVAEWQRGKMIPASLVNVLWDVLQGKRPELAAAADKRGSLAILSMAAIGDPQLLRCKLELLLRCLHGAKNDLTLARHACIALQRCAVAGPIDPKASKAVTKALEKILLDPPSVTEADEWYATAEQAIGTIFAVHHAPEALMTTVLHKMGAALSDADTDADADSSSVDSAALARLLFCVGHVAVKTLVHIEACRKVLEKRKSAMSNEGADAAEDEVGGQSSTEEHIDEIDHLAAHALVEESSLLGSWGPLVIAVCRNEGNHFGHELRASAVLTLCKMMCVSPTFCGQQLQLLFSLANNDPEPAIRANVAIALGDLFFRHTNVLTPWTSHMYALLRDDAPRVRKNVLMVLMHLVLNDMVKVAGQGQVSELSLCVLDGEERIASLAKLFFTEYAKKSDSPVYNLLPDIVSSLSARPELSYDSYREVLGFVITLIQKDKQNEAMVEKLCKRFDDSDEPRRHRQVAFCLSALAHTEKSIKKLVELFRTYSSRLGDDEVLANMLSLVSKTRKVPGAKVELKAACDELERMLNGSAEAHGAGARTEGDEGGVGGIEAEEDETARAASLSSAPTPSTKAGKKPAARKAKAKPTKKKPWEDEEDDDAEDADNENAAGTNKPARSEAPVASKAPARASRARGKANA